MFQARETANHETIPFSFSFSALNRLIIQFYELGLFATLRRLFRSCVQSETSGILLTTPSTM